MGSPKNQGSLSNTVYKRGELLCAIEEQPRAKPALTKAIDGSRSTVDRGVAELLDMNCIERRESTYHPTLLGTLSANRYRAYQSDMDALNGAGELVSSLPSATMLSTAFLKGADVYPADPAAPEAALQPSIDLIADATHLRGLGPVNISLYVDLLYENATTNGLTAEIIVEPDTLQPLLRTDGTRLRELVTNGQLELLVTDENIQYALWVMELPQRVAVGATIYEDGGIEGLIINFTTDAVKWAREQYERYHTSAESRPIDELLSE